MDKIEKAVARIDDGEDAWNDDDEVVVPGSVASLDKVIPIRLSSRSWSQLHKEARELGIGPTTLARMWILEKLRQNLPRSADSGSGEHPTERRCSPRMTPKCRNSVSPLAFIAPVDAWRRVPVTLNAGASALCCPGHEGPEGLLLVQWSRRPMPV